MSLTSERRWEMVDDKERFLSKVAETIEKLNCAQATVHDYMNLYENLVNVLGALHRIGGVDIAHELIRISEKHKRLPVIAIFVKAVGYDLLGKL